MMNTRFGEFGGQYIPEILMSEINHVAEAYEKYKNDPAFKAELKDLYANYTGRPSMLYEAKRMRADLGGPKIYLKREDLNHTGAHKINNCIFLHCLPSFHDTRTTIGADIAKKACSRTPGR